MRKVMVRLLALQQLQFEPRKRAAAETEMEKLRKQVPAPILAHYDRLVSRQKKGVSLARNGVCCECHLRIPGGKLVSLAHADEIHLCDNCGRYLHLPDDELLRLRFPLPGTAAKTPAKRSSRKALVDVA